MDFMKVSLECEQVNQNKPLWMSMSVDVAMEDFSALSNVAVAAIFRILRWVVCCLLWWLIASNPPVLKFNPNSVRVGHS